MLRFDHVSLSYGSQKILNDLCFEIEEGQFAVLIGPSGCGKTTTLKMINRLIQPDTGKIYLNEEDITSKDKVELRRHIGYVIQQIGLFPNMTVAQNICVVPKLLKYSKEQCDQIVRDMLAMVEMPYEQYANKYPSEMSGGQQQRIGILRALAASPPIVLMDEPFSALDPMTRRSLQQEVKGLQQKLHKTFIFVTHDQEEALTMSDTVVVMNNGHIQQIGSPIDIYNEPVNAFVADFIGESNIVNGCMPRDCLVEFAGKKFECVDKGFGRNEMVDVVIRPEDVKVIPAEQAQLTGIVESVVFKGVHYEMTVDCVDHKWLIHSTKAEPVGSVIGMTVDPFDIHIMKKSKQPGSYPALMGVNDNEEA